MGTTHFPRMALAAMAGAIGLSACGGELSPTGSNVARSTPAFAVGDPVTVGTEPTVGRIVLCKTGNVDGTFTIVNTPANGGNPSVIGTSVTVAKGTCKVIVEDGSPANSGSFTTITETSVGFVPPALSRFANIDAGTGFPVPPVDLPYTDGSTQLFANSFHGYRITYNNFVEPPPPPVGGQGCSPGYWKNHNFPAGYSKGQMFSSVFENAFPGKTLQQVLSTGGGGLISLGRHTVSALLNASALGTNYEYTTAQVIAKFNAAYASGNYSALAAEFAALQDVDGRICPNPTGK